MLIAMSLLVLAKATSSVVQVLTMVTLSFTLVGALAGLMGMNLYFAVATTPLVCNVLCTRDKQDMIRLHDVPCHSLSFALTSHCCCLFLLSSDFDTNPH